MKRNLLYICMLLAVVLGLSISVSAYTVTPSVYLETIDGYEEAYLRMYEAIAAGADSADLSDLKLSETEAVQIYSDIVGSCPEFFYLANRIAYTYTIQSLRRIVSSVEFVYTMEPEKREAAKLEYEQELAYIVSLVDTSMSDLEKALWVHDYLIASCRYDDSQSIYDAYGLFTGRTGVCQAYSLAYAAVMRELGVETVMVSSKEMNHAWNMVKIDGNWYHVDLVYDDPVPDRTGRVNHENFLLNDTQIAQTENPHYGWESALKSADASYTDNIWDGVTSRMLRLDGQWYYVNPETDTLVASQLDGRFEIEIYRFKEKWCVNGTSNQYWVGIYTGVSECLGYLFFNTPEQLMIHNPETGKTDIYLEIPDGRVFGSGIYKNTLEYYAAKSPEDEDGVILEYAITDFNIGNTVTILPFDDVSRMDSWYAAVRFVYERGLFQGVSSVKFAPDATLTRAMFVTVLGRLFGIDGTEYDTIRYTDVESGQWYAPYVEWASLLGIVNGIGEGLFDPLGEITHEQMCMIVARCGRLIGAGEYSPETVLPYEDAVSVSDWAMDGVVYCEGNGLISAEEGGLFEPKGKSTRAEAAEMISRFAVLCGVA